MTTQQQTLFVLLLLYVIAIVGVSWAEINHIPLI